MKKIVKHKEHPVVLVINNLIRLTTVPRENSKICWDRDLFFGKAFYRTEYKGKVYKFDGRHFYVYPAGYELPPGVSIGDKKGPDILIHILNDSLLSHLAQLWRAMEGQYAKEIVDERAKRDIYIKEIEGRQVEDRMCEHESAMLILKDFE